LYYEYKKYSPKLKKKILNKMYFSLETYTMVNMKEKKHIKEGDKNTTENTILMKTT